METFTQADYAKMVQALAKPGKDIADSMTPEKAHLLHMAIGIVGEATELLDGVLSNIDTNYEDSIIAALGKEQRENFIEEMGDIEFYMQGLCDGIHVDRLILANASLFKQTTEFCAEAVVVNAGNILDLIKKHVIYSKDIISMTPAIIKSLILIDDYMGSIRENIGVTRDEVIQANVKKLSKRYAEKVYSDAAAQARADKAG